MHSYGATTHSSVKILHSAAIFAASISEETMRKWLRRPFWAASGHFGTANQLFKKCRNAKIGKRNAYQSLQCDVLPIKISQCARISDLKK